MARISSRQGDIKTLRSAPTLSLQPCCPIPEHTFPICRCCVHTGFKLAGSRPAKYSKDGHQCFPYSQCMHTDCHSHRTFYWAGGLGICLGLQRSCCASHCQPAAVFGTHGTLRWFQCSLLRYGTRLQAGYAKATLKLNVYHAYQMKATIIFFKEQPGT